MKYPFNRMLTFLLLLLFVVLMTLPFVSCDIQKKSQKSKVDTNLKGSEEIKTFRAGDTVGYKPLLRPRYKDTTIYTYNRQGTTLETIYDKSGNVSDINCYASRIEELTKRNFELEQQSKDKASEKSEKINFDWLIYVVVGVVVVLIFALILIFIYISKNTKAVTEIITAIKDKV